MFETLNKNVQKTSLERNEMAKGKFVSVECYTLLRMLTIRIIQEQYSTVVERVER